MICSYFLFLFLALEKSQFRLLIISSANSNVLLSLSNKFFICYYTFKVENFYLVLFNSFDLTDFSIW